MIRTMLNPVAAKLGSGLCQCFGRKTRDFSFISVHRTFPATLHRYQVHHGSRLYDHNKKTEENEFDHAVELSRNGLVCPGGPDHHSSGPSFQPATQDMHDLLDNNHEYYKELVEGGRPPAEPHVLSLPKGTFIPESLTLFYETTEWFTLQPSHPMKLTDLNNTLTEFYSKHGIVRTVDEWLNKYPFYKVMEDREKWRYE